MAEAIHHDISGTAFVVNYSRSLKVDISMDIYAHLWVTQESVDLWNDLAKHVYPHDDLNLSLRNRFYLEKINRFISKHDDPVIIVLASGFTNYPFINSKTCSFIEVDLPNIMNYKEHMVKLWMKNKKLPYKEVRYISCDLSQRDQRQVLEEKLSVEINGRPCMITMEGLTYYLKEDVLIELLALCGRVQKPGSKIIFDFWKPDTMECPVMVKLKEYLNGKFGYSKQQWFLFDETFINRIPGYKQAESTDIAVLEQEYANSKLFQGIDGKIPVYFSIIDKE